MRVMHNIRILVNRILSSVGLQVSSERRVIRTLDQSLSVLKDIIPTPQTVIDVGFADGTEELTRIFSPEKHRYLLIEANPAFTGAMKKFSNKYRESLAVSAFCGETDGETEFPVNVNNFKSSRYAPEGGAIGKVKVPIRRLDTLIAEHNLSGPFLLKIDTEGSEIDVLKGAQATLQDCVAIVAEGHVFKRYAHASNFSKLTAYLSLQGFDIFDVYDSYYGKESGMLLMTNAVFVRCDNLRWKEGERKSN